MISSKRPVSANPKYLQLAGFQRPLSAQVRMGDGLPPKSSNKDNYQGSDVEVGEVTEEDEAVEIDDTEFPEARSDAAQTEG